MMVRAANVEADVPAGPDAAKKEPNPAECPDARLEILAPLIDAMQRVFLYALDGCVRLPRAQAQVARAFGPDIVEALRFGQANSTAVHEQTVFRIQSKAFDVVLGYVIVEAVSALGWHGIEFVDLYEMEAGHVGFAARRIDAVFFEYAPHFGAIP